MLFDRKIVIFFAPKIWFCAKMLRYINFLFPTSVNKSIQGIEIHILPYEKIKFEKFVGKIFHAFSPKKEFSTTFSRVFAAGRNTFSLFFSVLYYFACYKHPIMRVLEYPHKKNSLLSSRTN